MNAFANACMVEARAIARLTPLFDDMSNGHFVHTNKGTLARWLQLTAGDVLLNTRDGKTVAVELKAEERHTGNLFLETFSNRNLTDRQSHADRGISRGWLDHCRADWLFYFFEDRDLLYVVDLFELKRWAFVQGQIYKFRECVQRKYDQPNETVGRVVPVSVLSRALGRRFRVRNLSDVIRIANEGT
jgi:hypothetical protein